MSQKKLFSIVSIIIVASLLLAACGDPANLPAPQQTQIAANLAKVENFAENGPEMVATAAVGAAIQNLYDAEPNLAALLPLELCPNAKTSIYLDDEGWEHEVWLCNSHTLEELLGATSFEADLAVVAVATLSPVPGDEILAVASVGAKRIILLVAAATAAKFAADGLVAMSHGNWQHDPNFAGTRARDYIAAILAVWASYTATGGPPPNDKFRCGVVKAGETIVRVAVFMFFEDDPSMGRLAWYDVESGRWGGSFIARARQFFKGAKSYSDKGWTWETKDDSCSNLPGGGLPPLQPAN